MRPAFTLRPIPLLALLFAVAGTAVAQRRQALVVGLSSYQPARPNEPGITHLPNPHRDADRLARRLRELGWEVTLLVSAPGATASDATKERILSTLTGMGRSDKDSVLFAFSGHGFQFGGRDFLTTFDSHYDDSQGARRLVMSSLLDVEREIGGVFRDMPARRRLAVVDACRAQSTVDVKGDESGADAGGLAAKLAEAVGYSKAGSVYSAVLFSCAPGQRSYEDNRLDGGRGAGVFTEGILNALNDPTLAVGGEFFPDGVARRAADFVSTWSKGSGREMNPRLILSPNNDLTLTLSLGASAGSAKSVEAWLAEGHKALAGAVSEAGQQAAVNAFRKAAEAGDVEGMFWLAHLNDRPMAGPPDKFEAAVWYRKAANGGETASMNNLGAFYADGEGVAQNWTEAARWFRKAAEGGIATAMSWLGTCYRNGTGVEKDLKEAYRWFRKGSEAGDDGAMNSLAYALETGEGVAKDSVAARGWFLKSAEAGHNVAMFNLAQAYMDGKGGARNPAEAARWLRKSADGGYRGAMNGLGFWYETGAGVPKDEALAAQWYRKAAEAGDDSGMFNFARALSTGTGVARNPVEAERWFRKSVEGGSPALMTSLGVAYANGTGLTKDDFEAIRWFRNAAEKGYAPAMNWLGHMYENGRGAAKNVDEARNWYRKAVDLGDVDAKKSLTRLGG